MRSDQRNFVLGLAGGALGVLAGWGVMKLVAGMRDRGPRVAAGRVRRESIVPGWTTTQMPMSGMDKVDEASWESFPASDPPGKY